MVKDEDLCLHCGLCAERCPTGAWDMMKFTIEMAQAGHSCRSSAVNDFVIRFANVNGSGSASANLLFARSILRMGVPIAPRNIFPSNIQGLPTWYEVRVSEEGWLGARGGADILVAMNAQTFAQDVAALEPGGYLFYDSSRPLPPSSMRDDIVILGMPLTEICAAQYSDPRQRQLYKNIVYVGALAALLDIDLAVMEKLTAERFKGKDKLIEANQRALRIGHDEARSRFECPLGIRIRRSAAVGDRILVEGNYAAGLGAVYGGATVCAWYPITPSTSLAEAFERNCARYRVDKATGKKNYAIVQAEDEIAAIGIAVGAGWNGARAFTATSGPGISLMQEFFGLAYFAEIPVVVFDVQRGGPSTGMPTRTQQSDLLSCAFASHGDTKHVLLIPDGPNEAFEFAARAFDLAERLQTVVFVMLDLDIGMNSHLSAPFQWDDARVYDRGKVLSFEKLEKAPNFGRYDDVDGDGIPYRTLPGAHPTRGAYFTRGTSRDRFARYTEEGLPYIDNMERLERKFETARGLLPRPVLKRAAKPTRVGVLQYGSTSASMDEAQKMLADEGLACRHPAHPRVSDDARGRGIHRQPRSDLCGRAKSRRADAHADLDRSRRRDRPLDADPPLQRHADLRPLHLSRNRGASAHACRNATSRGRRVTYLAKPKFHHPSIPVNALGFTHRDYEGSMSTLCAGCGHDAISAAIIHACFELSLPPHRVAKLSGIGCSSKTPTYMLGQSHGFNSVHGRMPSVLTGANLANRDLIYLGVSGDGDTASIGLGQFAHAMRRGVNMVYIVENNGVYGLTKGQFSATADRGSTSKKGAGALDQPIDLVGMAIGLGASFVARSFSGDKAQLVPLIKAAFEHRGAAFIDVISPCVTFNNHAGSTKSFDYVREHNIAVNALDVITRAGADRDRLCGRREPGGRDARRLDDRAAQARRRSQLPRPVGGARHARARPRRRRDRHRPHLHQRGGRRAARHPRHDGAAAQRARRARTLPGIEGARRDQRVAEVGRITARPSRAQCDRLSASSSSMTRRKVANSNGLPSVERARYLGSIPSGPYPVASANGTPRALSASASG